MAKNVVERPVPVTEVTTVEKDKKRADFLKHKVEDKEAQAEAGPEAAGKEAPIEQKLTGEALETYESLNSKSQKFVYALFERASGFLRGYKITENLGDRLQIWNNEKVAKRGNIKVTELRKNIEGEQKTIQEAGDSIEQVRVGISSLEKLLRGQGRELSADAAKKAEEEISQHENRRTKADVDVKGLESRIKAVDREKSEFETKAEGAKGRFDGRLADKMKANQIELDILSKSESLASEKLESNKREIEKLSSHQKELEELRQTTKAKSVLQIIDGEIDKLKQRSDDFERKNAGLERFSKRIKPKIDSFQKTNADLQSQRENIMGKPPAEVKKTSAKPAKAEEAAELEPPATAETEAEEKPAPKAATKAGPAEEPTIEFEKEELGVEGKRAEKQKMLTVGEVISKWNQWAKEKKLQSAQWRIKPDTFQARANKEVDNAEKGRQFLLDQLRRKVGENRILTKQVNQFWNQRMREAK